MPRTKSPARSARAGTTRSARAGTTRSARAAKRPTTPVVSASDGAILCASSFQAFACAVAALIAGHTALSALAVVTFLLSLNFWSKPEYGARRNLDFLCACSALIISLHQTSQCRRPLPILSLYAAACGLWLVAAWRWSRADRRWVWWHVSFHACSTAANLLLYECLR